MRNKPRQRSSAQRARKFRVVLYGGALAVFAAALAACGGGGSDEARGVIIVNAPVAGEVRRVLVREGMVVNEGTPIVEIAVRTEAQSAPQPSAEDPVARAGRNIGTAQAGIDAARAEAVRAEVEVQRLTPLVASGDASQAQLDGARAVYERAQRRLQDAQSAAQDAQSGLVAARRQPRNTVAAPVAPAEQIVAAEATSAGTVSVVSARVGDRVTAGQPLATLRAVQ
ncbi:MAG TPA: biotin/lipoyl-binding protein [Pyrinomonadaceae bacterium]|nr:biotin/lipoyl-binding protein [Pyrinomonadaceae bacterium]